MLQSHVRLSTDEIEAFCRRYPIRKLSLFGSVLREDFTPESDIDVLVEFEANAGIGYFELVQMQTELSALLGRTVDLLTPNALSKYFRADVLNSAQVIYEKSEQNDAVRLLHLRDAAQKALRFVNEESRESFEANEMLQLALVASLAIIGEAANGLTETFRAAHPQIPWALIIGTRHRVIHGYDQIDLDIVWDTVTRNLPELLRQLQPLLPPTDDAS